MRKFMWVVFVVAVVVVAFETFRPQAPFPSTDMGYWTSALQTFLLGR
ncbi:MAG: hypothetical protein K6T78_01240 [Alicyclobacillus sp.]|nr:hypothetical protein [Alicyclobacillus sp.]